MEVNFKGDKNEKIISNQKTSAKKRVYSLFAVLFLTVFLINRTKFLNQ